MAVYVDDMYKSSLGNYRGMKMSHMVADSTEELLVMADKIGVNRKWIHGKGESNEHFDICFSKRQKAIRLGAIEIPMRKLAVAVVHGRASPNEKIILIGNIHDKTNNHE